MRRRFLLQQAVLLLALCAGCGGGGGGGSETVLPRITIQWAARSGAGRATDAPSTAQSAVIRVIGAAENGSDVVFLAQRRADLAAYSETYTATAPARLGTYPVRIAFFALDNASGDLVATAEGTATLTKAGLLPDLTTTGKLASLEVVSNQQLALGERRALAFVARTSEGTLLAITAGSAFWSVTSGGAVAIRDDAPYGLAPGTARVRVQAGGVTSPDAEVRVVSGASVQVTPSVVRLTLRGTQQLTAQVVGAPLDDVVWSVREGAAGGSVSSTGLYTAPDTPGLFHVVATSVYDSSRSGEAEIQVDAGGLTVGGTWGDSGGLGVGLQ